MGVVVMSKVAVSAVMGEVILVATVRKPPRPRKQVAVEAHAGVFAKFGQVGEVVENVRYRSL
jgi:hypothetical protein